MKTTLKERACEAIRVYRQVDIYFRDTFCKMSQGLASNRSWREAEEAKVACEQEFQEIAEWASKLKKGWGEKIFPECVQVVDLQQRKQFEQQQREEARIMHEMQEKQREKAMAKAKAAEKKYSSNESEVEVASVSSATAKAAEEELLREEDEARKAKKRTGKGKN